jgi:hypothetical protein
LDAPLLIEEVKSFRVKVMVVRNEAPESKREDYKDALVPARAATGCMPRALLG